MKIRKLESGDFLVHMDVDLRSLAERKMYVTVGKNGVPQYPDRLPIVVRFARSRKMVEMLCKGAHKTRADLCKVFKMTHGTLSRTLRFAFLSPVIVEKVVTGQLSATLVMAKSEELITHPIWADQHNILGIP